MPSSISVNRLATSSSQTRASIDFRARPRILHSKIIYYTSPRALLPGDSGDNQTGRRVDGQKDLGVLGGSVGHPFVAHVDCKVVLKRTNSSAVSPCGSGSNGPCSGECTRRC